MLLVLFAFFRLSSFEYFRPETTFSASDHRGIFSTANDYFLPLWNHFLIFFLRLPFFEFIAIHRQEHTIFAFPVETKKDVFFSFYLFPKIILFWCWFCFFMTRRCCLRRLVRWIRWWWQLRWIFSRYRDNRDNSSLLYIHILRTTTGMFLVCVSTYKFAPYCHTLYLLLCTEVFKGTLMQIWKSASIFVFIWKSYVDDFTLKHLLFFETCAREICENFFYKHSETIE